jgi:hypothetical protein
MPAPIALLLGFAIGAALAFLARQELTRGDDALHETRAFTVACLFAVFVWAPVTGYFLAFHGDWAYFYGVPWRRIPSALDLVVVLAAAAVVPAGFVAAVPAVRARSRQVVAGLVGGPIAVVLVLTLALFGRLRTSATYAQFHGHFGRSPVFGSTLGKSLGWAALVLLAGAALSALLVTGRWRFPRRR